MYDKEQLAYDLSLLYAYDVIKNRPLDDKNEPIWDFKAVNKLLLCGFKKAYKFNSEQLGLAEKEV